jgi:predicted ribosomally synthesized peptide with SipW-like signal peptide
MRAVTIGLAVVGGLLLVGGTLANWTQLEVTRQIGGIAVSDTNGVAGVQFAPLGVPLGVLVLICGPALALAPSRRMTGAALALLGIAGIAVLTAGAVQAAAAAGALTMGPAVAGAGALCGLVAGLLTLWRPPAATPSSRYTVEGVADREWDLAAEEDSTS